MTGRESYKRLKFDHTTEGFIHKLEYGLENEMQKILWDFELHTDHLIPTRRHDLVWINTKKELAVLEILQFQRNTVKIKGNENKYLNLAKELKMLWDVRVSVIPTVVSTLRTRENRDHPNHSIVEIG